MNTKAIGALIIVALAFYYSGGPGLITQTSTPTVSTTVSTTASTTGVRLGFWVDIRDIWSGSPYRSGTITPQIFFNDYFLTSPYPASFVWAFNPIGGSGPNWPGPAGSSNWFASVLTIADGYQNIRIEALYFLVSGSTLPWDTSGYVTDPAALQMLDYWLSQVSGHGSFLGVIPETEYINGGSSQAQIQAFYDECVKYGVPYLEGTGYPSPSQSTSSMWYSTYPFYGGTIPSTLPSSSIGISYGETGAPNCDTQNPCPIWTEPTILSIVDGSQGHIVIINCWDDQNNPIGNSHLEFNPTLRGWIASDPHYQSNYVKSS